MNGRSPGQVWEATLGSLELQVSRPIYSTWLKDTFGLSFDGTEFVIGTPSAFVAEWLGKRMSSLIEATLSRVLGQPVAVQFRVEPERRTANKALLASPQHLEPPSPGSPGCRPPGGAALSFRLNPRYTLASFIVGQSNQLAYAAAQAVSSRPGDAYNPLFLYAGVGLGKTHLLHAIGHASAQKGLSYLYASSEQFTNDFVTSIQTKRTREFREKYRSVDVLLIDDIQFMQGKEAIQEGFFHTFNDLHNTNRQIVIASDRPTTSLSAMEDRLRSRFEWGLSADMQTPDPETRLAILQAKADGLGIPVPRDVLELIADSFPNSIRDLEGALNRVTAFADLTSRPMTLEMAHDGLGDLLAPPRERVLSPTEVISRVCSFYKTSLSSISGKRRDRTSTRARQVAVYLLREVTQSTLSDIGSLLGGRDHATIRYSWLKVSKMRLTDSALQQEISAITKALHQ